MSSISDACCNTPSISSSLLPEGHLQEIETAKGNMSVYVTGKKNATKAIITLYDVFGFHNVTKKFCDKVAKKVDVDGKEEAVYKVVMPDFFFGQPLDEKMLGSKDVMMEFLRNGPGSLNNVTPLLKQIQEWLTKENVEVVGLIGFCWGGKRAIETLADDGKDSFKLFKAASLIHPSLVDVSDAKRVRKDVAVLTIPSKDEPDMTEFMDALKENLPAENCEHYRFDDVHHGFAAARANLDDKTNLQRFNEAIQHTHNFFSKHL